MIMRHILLLLIIPLSAFSQKDYRFLLQQYMDAKANVTSFSGVVLVMKKGDTLLKKTYGYSNKKLNVPTTFNNQYCLGSVTKQFTAACILQLEEKGKLKTTDKLSKFFPDFPRGDSVTLHMLLNHTSGLPDFLDKFEWTSDTSTQSQKQIYSMIKNLPYQFSPGTGVAYSNVGYYLLGLIVQKASGLKYGIYLNQHIFKPAGMKSSGLLSSNDSIANLSKVFVKNDTAIIESEIYKYFDVVFSAGAMYSTASDLYKWDRVLMGNKILSSESKKKMFTPNPQHFGYGFIIDTLASHPVIFHDGKYDVYTAIIDRFVVDDACIIVLSNNDANMGVISSSLASILFDKEVITPYVHKETPIAISNFDKYLGTYKFKDSFDTLRIVNVNGKLFRSKSNRKDVELKTESLTKLFYIDSDNQIEFSIDSQEKQRTWFIQNGLKREMVRME